MGTPDRRRDIVEAALSLLAEVPLSDLTTRRIARRVGVSQPALFRHFRSREQILLAVVEHVRARTSVAAAQVFESHAPPDGKLERLAAALLHHVEDNPGLPRLLFGQPPDDDPVGLALRQLVASQTALVAELVREGRERGVFATRVEPREAAALFVGMLQGLALQWELGGRAEPLAERARGLFTLLRDGLHGRDDATASPAPHATDEPPPADGLRSLDVRPIVAGGGDPLDEILSAVDAVGPRGLVTIVAPFEPRPLLSLLRSRGHRVRSQRLEPRVYAVDVVVGGAPEILELGALEPPEPLERVLEACERIGPGDVVLAHVPRYPRLLLPRLEERGLTVQTHERLDGTALVRVWRPR